MIRRNLLAIWKNQPSIRGNPPRIRRNQVTIRRNLLRIRGNQMTQTGKCFIFSVVVRSEWHQLPARSLRKPKMRRRHLAQVSQGTILRSMISQMPTNLLWLILSDLISSELTSSLVTLKVSTADISWQWARQRLCCYRPS